MMGAADKRIPVVRVYCPINGEVDVPATAISVREHGGRGTYSFRCPKCHETVARPTTEEGVRLLKNTNGVNVVVDRETEMTDFLDKAISSGAKVTSPDFVLDDVIEFHELLNGPDGDMELDDWLQGGRDGRGEV